MSRLRRAFLSIVGLGLVLSPFGCKDTPSLTKPTGPVASLDIISGDSQHAVAGTALASPIVVKALDASGDPLSGQLVTFRVTAGGGSVFAGASITNGDGVAQELWTLGTATADSQRVEVRAVDATTGAPLVFAVFRASATAAAAAIITKSSVDSTESVAGGATSVLPRVRVGDQYGNAVSGTTVIFAVTGGGGAISGGTQTTDDSGFAVVGSWALGSSLGVNSLTATATGLTGSPVAFTATGTIGMATSLSILAGDNGTGVVGTTSLPNPRVRVTDAAGRGVPGVSVTFAVESGTSSISLLAQDVSTFVATTGTDGSVGIVWELGNVAKPTTLSASSPGLAGSPLLFSSTISAGPAVKLLVTTSATPNPQSGVVFPIQPVIQLADHFGNAVTQAGKSISAAGTGLGGTKTQITSSSGAATFTDLVLSTASGSQVITFMTSAPPSISSTTDTVTVGSSSTYAMAVNAGDQQTAAPGTTLPVSPSVLITDGSGHPMAGVGVQFSVASGGGSVSGGTTTTQSNGVATLGSWTLGSAAGANTLSVSAPATGLAPLTITATGAANVHLQTVVAGAAQSCSLTAGGAAYCWGANHNGTIGDGTTTDRRRPVAVVGGLSFQQLTAGDGQTCGLTSGGAAYCWGLNAYGSVGDGSLIDRLSPVVVTGGLSFQSIAAGTGVGPQTCGLTSAGSAYCWGENAFGELGDGTTDRHSNPVAVSGGQTFHQIATGYFFTCGLTGTGAAYCWGRNAANNLGDGTSANRAVPVAVQGGVTFSSIAVGAYHACGLTAGGAAYCWGDNSAGAVGNGAATVQPTPVPVLGGLTFASISAAGGSHTCGLTGAGVAWCWGLNTAGELGDGTTTNRSTPVAVSGELTFQSLSAGLDHTCGVTTGGALYCWGANYNGYLGDGTLTTRLTPTAVTPP